MSKMLGPLVTTEWLMENISKPNVKTVDCSSHMPTSPRVPQDDYNECHLDGAIFLDIEVICDNDSGLPHTVPTPEMFQSFAQKSGINNDDIIVVYDNSAIRTAARGRWMFRYFGKDNVYVLDGGLQKWNAEGKPTTDKVHKPSLGNFTCSTPLAQMRTVKDLLENLETKTEQVIDARAGNRFKGIVAEPREGLRSGHIPDSLNLPFLKLINGDGCYRTAEEAQDIFSQAKMDTSKPVVTSCGSGVTACVLALSLELMNKHDVSIYDGSWSEWGAHPDTPVNSVERE